MSNNLAFNQIIDRWNQMSSEEREQVKKALRSKQKADIDAMNPLELGIETVSNIPSSVYQVGEDLVTAMFHPVQTAKTLKDLAVGTVQNVFNVGDDKEAQAMASKVADFYAERYGSLDGFKYAFTQDPAGVLGDVSAVFGVGAMTLPGKAGKIAGAAASAIEPLTLATQVVKKGASKVPGLDKLPSSIGGALTGTGGDPLREAYLAGKTGGERAASFTDFMRGRGNPQTIIESVGNNLATLKDKRSQQYRAGMANIKTDATVLKLDDIYDALDSAKSMAIFKGVVKNPKAAAALEEVEKIVNEWAAKDPASFHTPEGLDALKQRIGAEIETIPYEQKRAYSAVNDIYKSVSSTISKQAPTYAKVMKNYSEAEELIREIQRTLSFNPTATVDTQLRKLTSVMRNNVNTSYGYRGKLVDELEAAGPDTIKPQIAGMALETWTPRGLQGPLTGAGAAYNALTSGMDPVALAQSAGIMAATSPRLIAETAHAAGISVRKVEEMFNKYPQMAYIKDPMTRLAFYQAQEAQEIGTGERY